MSRTTVEFPEYVAMLRRMIRAGGRRAAQADPEDLAELVTLRAELDAAIAEAVAGVRAGGRSWAEIGRATGTTKQAAQQRWARQSQS